MNPLFPDRLRDVPSSPNSGSYSSEEDAKAYRSRLPAIGVFWDIENCQVPRGRSAAAVAQTIRSRFFEGHHEVEFLVVCDVTKENPRIIEELNCAKVNLIHVSATSKNAADDKLRQRIRHFGETYASGSTLLLISGDINFSSELIELRHRRMMRVVLLHNQNTSEALKICANEHYQFSRVLDHLPEREEVKEEMGQVEVLIYNIPEHEPPNRIRARLKHLCYNCGGRVGYFARNLYYVRFSSVELAMRAQRRMDGQDVFGRRITVSEPRSTDWSRTPGRNRPKGHQDQEELVKPWDNLVSVNTHTPTNQAKVAGIENLRHLNTGQQQHPQQQQLMQNNLRKVTMQAAHTSSLAYRLNNQCDSTSRLDYRTDSSSGACDDDDSDIETPGSGGDGPSPSGPVDLRVTGLDPGQDLRLSQSMLAEAFYKYAKVLNLSVFTQTDGSVVGSVRVKSLSDAQSVIANLQRARLGNSRIKIAFNNSNPEQRYLIRRQVGDLLAKMPQSKLPLFRFKEMFKKEYLTSVSLSELRRMRDLCIISEDENGRMITVNPWARGSPFLHTGGNESVFCDQHYRMIPGLLCKPAALPCVKMNLNTLSDRVKELVQAHGGRLPLASINHCYYAHYGPLPLQDEDGVPLEHLVSCVPGIEIIRSQASHKFLAFSNGQEFTDRGGRVTDQRGLTSQLLELLKASPRATLSFSSFIPAYHHRFGKQFRLSDYGHTKLLDLLEAMPHIVQVLGFESNRQVTLSHKSQMKRFKIDVLKMLKTLPKKVVELSTFPDLYRQIFNRPFEPSTYGLCELEDLLNCCVGAELQLTNLEHGRTLLCVNIREQTPEEQALTLRFKAEVVELLKHNADCSMPFNKFVPAYHNYFGKQCRVFSYGFHKLVDLFEAITDTVTIEESAASQEKLLTLTLSERLKVLGEMIHNVVSAHGGSLMLSDLESVYEMYQYSVIDPGQFECDSLIQLLQLLSDYVKVVSSPRGNYLQAVPLVDTMVLDLRTRYLLLNRDQLSVDSFHSQYAASFSGTDLNVELQMSRIPQTAKIITQDGCRLVQLTPRAIFANQVYTLLFEHNGVVPLIDFESMFTRRFGAAMQPLNLGFTTISSLLSGFPETFAMRSGHPTHSYLELNPNVREGGFSLPLPPSQSYTLWERQPLFDTVLPITPPKPSCLPMPDALLNSKRNPRLSSQLSSH